MRGGSSQLSPVLVAHQEGVVGALAVGCLALTADGPLGAVSAAGPLGVALAVGVAAGAGMSGLAWLLTACPPVRELERFQSELVGRWSLTESLAVAALSGLAEEALIRAVLQPLIGLVAATAVFAVLHVVPDRRAWPWPVLAFGLGLGFGLLFERWGYPAAAAAHVTVNTIGLLRSRRLTDGES